MKRVLGASILTLVIWLSQPLFGAVTLARDPDPDPDPNSAIWNKVRQSLFENRSISDAADRVIEMEAPFRVEDAATVPIVISAKLPQSADRYIRNIYLVIDKNPSPIAAVFRLTPESGRADIETRVRIEEYTHVRAIAEMNDGKLYMTARFVRASGGCSAPAGKDQEAALARLGRMKFRLDDRVVLGEPNPAQLMISHPNNSGLAMDPLTRLYVPARFVRKVDVTYAGRPIFSAEVNFSISENPNFRFYFVPRDTGELKAEVIDSQDFKFIAHTPVKPIEQPGIERPGR